MPDLNSEKNARSPRVVIVLSCVSPVQPASSVVPFRYAAAAAAMDIPVEIHAVNASVLLLRRGVPENLFPEGTDAPSLLTQIRVAADLGVKIFACPAAMAQHGVGAEDMIGELTGVQGAVSMLCAGLEPGARFITF